MEHAGLFRVIVLVYLMVCSHVGLLKNVAFEICQTKSITMLKSGRGHGGDGDGIGKIKIKLRELCKWRSVRMFYSVESRMGCTE